MCTESTALHQLEQAILCSVARGHGPQPAGGGGQKREGCKSILSEGA